MEPHRSTASENYIRTSTRAHVGGVYVLHNKRYTADAIRTLQHSGNYVPIYRVTLYLSSSSRPRHNIPMRQRYHEIRTALAYLAGHIS